MQEFDSAIERPLQCFDIMQMYTGMYLNNRISNVADKSYDKSYDKSKLINCVIHLETIVSDKKILLLSHTARVI